MLLSVIILYFVPYTVEFVALHCCISAYVLLLYCNTIVSCRYPIFVVNICFAEHPHVYANLAGGMLGVAYQPNHRGDNYTPAPTLAVYRVLPVSTAVSRADLLRSLSCTRVLQLTVCACVRSTHLTLLIFESLENTTVTSSESCCF